MTVRIGLIRKKSDWSFDEFDAYWRDRHGSLAARAPNLRAYWQNSVVDRLQRGIDFPRGPWNFDGFSQLWFDDAGVSTHAFGTGEIAAELVRDESHFMADLHIVTAQQDTVIPLPEARGDLLKRISVIERRSDISEQDFRREWKVHGHLVRKMPGVSAYRQNVVMARELHKGEPCDYASLPIDGIVELWFQDVQRLQAAFSSAAGQSAMAHAKTFLGEITAFLVQERRIV